MTSASESSVSIRQRKVSSCLSPPPLNFLQDGHHLSVDGSPSGVISDSQSKQEQLTVISSASVPREPLHGGLVMDHCETSCPLTGLPTLLILHGCSSPPSPTSNDNLPITQSKIASLSRKSSYNMGKSPYTYSTGGGRQLNTIGSLAAGLLSPKLSLGSHAKCSSQSSIRNNSTRVTSVLRIPRRTPRTTTMTDNFETCSNDSTPIQDPSFENDHSLLSRQGLASSIHSTEQLCYTATCSTSNTTQQKIATQENTNVPHPKLSEQIIKGVDIVFESKECTSGVHIRAAKIDRLIEELVKSYADSSPSRPEYAKTIFLVHKWFMTSVELAQRIIALSLPTTLRECFYSKANSESCSVMSLPESISAMSYSTLSSFDAAPSSQSPSYITEVFGASESGFAGSEMTEFSSTSSRVFDAGSPKPFTQRRFSADVICKVFESWIEKLSHDFYTDPHLKAVVGHFAEMIFQGSQQNSFLQKFEDTLSAIDLQRSSSGKGELSRQKNDPQQHVTLVFNQISPVTLARQLTVIEFKAFKRIQFHELKKYACTNSCQESENLESSISLFNGLSQWVQCMILNKSTPEERAHVISKFAHIAKKLLELKNFNSFFAVAGGMTHSCIARLGKTSAALSFETQQLLQEFSDILMSSNNFAVYRKMLSQAGAFRIPVLAVHLRDLVAIHTALPNYEGDELINVRKLVQLANVFNILISCQVEELPVEENKELCNILRLSLVVRHTEEEIYELSLAKEPRNSTSTTTPSQSVVFADFVAGQRPPDLVTLKKHVQNMVDAVFSVYDNDKDGFISSEEFSQIADNFPFLESFAVLDADNDGMISRAELNDYFIRANGNALRNSFKHEFHEYTYFKPTYCKHCTGLLWGIIKQGWRCRVCGINAHKHCKDLVVAECRSRQSFSHKMGANNSGANQSCSASQCQLDASGTNNSTTSGPGESQSQCGSGKASPPFTGSQKSPSSMTESKRKYRGFRNRLGSNSNSFSSSSTSTLSTTPVLPARSSSKVSSSKRFGRGRPRGFSSTGDNPCNNSMPCPLSFSREQVLHYHRCLSVSKEEENSYSTHTCQHSSLSEEQEMLSTSSSYCLTGTSHVPMGRYNSFVRDEQSVSTQTSTDPDIQSICSNPHDLSPKELVEENRHLKVIIQDQEKQLIQQREEVVHLKQYLHLIRSSSQAFLVSLLQNVDIPTSDENIDNGAR